MACWIAPRDVPPGAQYADAIVRAINSAKVLILVLSESAVGSAHVGKEIERASAKGRPIIALRIDAAPLTPALEYFLSESQWIEARSGATDAALPKLIDAVRRLLAAAPKPPFARESSANLEAGHPIGKRSLPRPVQIGLVLLAVLAVGAIALFAGRHWISSPAPDAASTSVAAPSLATPAPSAASFSPPAHSLAVLPFVNMSGDKEQEYFSDGLSEELLNSLATIPDLRVAARTSSFSFKGSTADTAEIAHKLNVGAILEGSVRKVGAHIRITAQLINAVTGFQLWSKTYDRDLKDVLKLQTEVATEVTTALQATLMGGAAARVDLGSTENPAAFDAFLRGEKGRRLPASKAHDLERIAAYDEAIRLDPQFAKAYVGKATALVDLANYLSPAEGHDVFDQALAAVRKAVELAPDLGTAHSAYATALALRFEFAHAEAEFDRALQLAPGNADVLRQSSGFLSGIGRTAAALDSAKRAVALDPLNPAMHRSLGDDLYDARRYPESLQEFDQAISLSPTNADLFALRGLSQLALGRFDAARQDCATPPLDWMNQTCLAIVYDKLHRTQEAKAALDALRSGFGDTAAYQNAQIYAQWGDSPKSLDWLETAYRIQDPGLGQLKVDPLIDPVRGEVHYRQILKKLNFPD
jgi:TolB-like protein/tetratricopeptide (TPR) repeat protein